MCSQEGLGRVEGITKERGCHASKAPSNETFQGSERFAGYGRIGVGALLTKTENQAFKSFKGDKLDALRRSDLETVGSVTFEETTKAFGKKEETQFGEQGARGTSCAHVDGGDNFERRDCSARDNSGDRLLKEKEEGRDGGERCQ